MRTLVELSNSNCPWCLNALLEELAGRERVTAVHSDASRGCLVVEHEHDDPAALLTVVRHDMRAVALADNGERVMVSVDAHEADRCRFRSPRT